MMAQAIAAEGEGMRPPGRSGEDARLGRSLANSRMAGLDETVPVNLSIGRSPGGSEPDNSPVPAPEAGRSAPANSTLRASRSAP